MVPTTFEEDSSRHRSGPSRHVIKQTSRAGHAENPRREHRVCVLHRRSKGPPKKRHRKTPSEALFASEGFTPTSFSEVSKRHGNLHTLNLYREMLVVPGEVLLRKAMT